MHGQTRSLFLNYFRLIIISFLACTFRVKTGSKQSIAKIKNDPFYATKSTDLSVHIQIRVSCYLVTCPTSPHMQAGGHILTKKLLLSDINNF